MNLLDDGVDRYWSIERDLLRDHAAERESQQVDAKKIECLREGEHVTRHTRDGVGHGARRAPDPRMLEQDHFAPMRQRVGHRRIPAMDAIVVTL